MNSIYLDHQEDSTQNQLPKTALHVTQVKAQPGWWRGSVLTAQEQGSGKARALFNSKHCTKTNQQNKVSFLPIKDCCYNLIQRNVAEFQINCGGFFVGKHSSGAVMYVSQMPITYLGFTWVISLWAGTFFGSHNGWYLFPSRRSQWLFHCLSRAKKMGDKRRHLTVCLPQQFL